MRSRERSWGRVQGKDSGWGQGTYCVPGADIGSSRYQGLTGPFSQLRKLCRLPDPQIGHHGCQGEDVSSVVPPACWSLAVHEPCASVSSSIKWDDSTTYLLGSLGKLCISINTGEVLRTGLAGSEPLSCVTGTNPPKPQFPHRFSGGRISLLV